MLSKLAVYRKFIVAVIGVILIGLHDFAGVTLPFDAEGITNVVLSLLTAVGVLVIPNSQPAQPKDNA